MHHGLDLVELQLQVASGAALPAEPPAIRGHSIEVRLYAEDPAHNWRPQSGTVERIELPGDTVEFDLLARTGVRLDSGVEDGSVVSVFYDPMLAKVISYAPTRTQAAQVLASALARTRLHGLRTNRDLLVNVLRHPAFLAGDTDTAFFDTHGSKPWRGRWPARGPSRCPRWPRRWPTPLRTGARHPSSVDCRAGGGTYRRSRRSSGTAESTATTTSATC